MYDRKCIMPYPANTKHLYTICTTSVQRLRRWANIVQMSYKCFCVCWMQSQQTLTACFKNKESAGFLLCTSVLVAVLQLYGHHTPVSGHVNCRQWTTNDQQSSRIADVLRILQGMLIQWSGIACLDPGRLAVKSIATGLTRDKRLVTELARKG